MRPPIEFFNIYGVWINLIYYLLVSIVCFWIFQKTKAAYELTSYEGIKYFRNTFLFFGITTIIKLFLSLMQIPAVHALIPMGFDFFILRAGFFVMVYTSSLALIYIIYSIFWKRITGPVLTNAYFINLIALIIALLSLPERNAFIFLILQSFLFAILIIASYLTNKQTNKTQKHHLSKLYGIYFLIFALWLISNFLELITVFSPIFGVLIYIISIIVFFILLDKVAGRLKFK